MKKIIIGLVKFIMLIIVIIAGLFVYQTIQSRNSAQVITNATLTDIINISDLSTAEFIYNGIATVYKDVNKEKVKYNIKYNSIVKASIDMQKVDFEIDNENKKIKPILPEIELTPTLIADSYDSFSFIPYDTNIELDEIINVCKEDSIIEASESTELRETAKQNVQNTIEALLCPIVENYEYQIIWD